MKTRKKALLLLFSAVMLVTASVLGTMAYLTSQDEVVNTFTVGEVGIRLDEAKTDVYGKIVEGVDRVKENTYKLLPGHEYSKDPMVTVLDGSENSYIKMTVAITKSTELDEIFGADGADLMTIFQGYDGNTWLYKGNTEDSSANTRTYEFWYKELVAAADGNVELDALFDSIKVPGEITNKQLATIEGMTITVNAYAIQADGFENADAAWEAFSTDGN